MTDSSDSKPGKALNFATQMVQAGRRAEWTGTPSQPGACVNPPVWRASTYLHPDSESIRKSGGKNYDGHFHYGRRGSPTQWALAEAITALEPQGHGTMLYPSGMAAISSALLAFLSPGDEVLISDNSYDPTRALADGLLRRMGITARYFDPAMGGDIASLFNDKTRIIWMESPGSLTMEVQDVPTICAAAREYSERIITMVDNTWGSGYFFRALDHGADISVLACTKYIVGHSDVMMGSATANERCWRELRKFAQQTGQTISPDDAWLALRGIRTLAVRMQHHQHSALQIARWLVQQPHIAHVLHPALASCPGNALWQRDFTGSAGLFSFVFKGGSREARAAFVDNLEHFGIGFSWGGFESLALPADPEAVRSTTGWPPAHYDPQDRWLVRLQIGLEDVNDLIGDLAQGLAHYEKMLS